MMKFKDDRYKTVAVLHDVIEDTKITYQDLLDRGLDKELANVVLILTRRKKESYDEYLNRICFNEFAIKVKLADLEDNMDMSRIKNPTEKDFQRLAKYGIAREILTNILLS